MKLFIYPVNAVILAKLYFLSIFQDVRVPVQLQRAMAAEAEAAREARAKVVAAEGEQKASLHLKEAALVLEESTSALQLRYLQVCQLLFSWCEGLTIKKIARFRP